MEKVPQKLDEILIRCHSMSTLYAGVIFLIEETIEESLSQDLLSLSTGRKIYHIGYAKSKETHISRLCFFSLSPLKL